MAKKYLVTLSEEERHAIELLTKKGKASARRLTRAHILRLSDAQQTDATIAAALNVGVVTVERIREKFVIGGLDWALAERPRLGGRRKLDGKQEALLVAFVLLSSNNAYQVFDAHAGNLVSNIILPK